MAVTRLATAKATFTSASSGATTAAFNSTGATLIEVTVVYEQSATGVTVSDSKGNSYTALTASPSSDSAVCRKYYAYPTSVGASHTVTLSGTNAYATFVVGAYGGAALLYQSQASASVGSGTTISTGSVTPTTAPALVTSGIEMAGTAPVGTPTAPMTLVDGSVGVPGAAYGVSASDEIQTTATTRNPTWTYASVGSRVGCTACYAVAAAAASVRVTHVVIETLSMVPVVPDARMTQLVVETLSPAGPVIGPTADNEPFLWMPV